MEHGPLKIVCGKWGSRLVRLQNSGEIAILTSTVVLLGLKNNGLTEHDGHFLGEGARHSITDKGKEAVSNLRRK